MEKSNNFKHYSNNRIKKTLMSRTISSPTLSVIIPVYKAERTLERCVRSVQNQSFQDWEMILIDDGSPDKSGELCDIFARKDSRIKVFHKDNGGVSSARNLGIENAIGERITFIDSDDEILPGFFEKTLQYDEDVVSGGTFRVTSINDILVDEVPSPAVFIGQKEIFDNVHKKGPRFTGPYSMIWKRSVIGEIRFNTSMIFGEDSLFSTQCLLNSNSVRTIDNLVYKYYVPSDMSCKYKMSVEEAVRHLNLFYSTTDSIPNINPYFCADRYRALFSASFRDVYFRPWVFANSETMRTYFVKYEEFFPIEFKTYYKKWFSNWFFAYCNFIFTRILKICKSFF